MVEVEFPSGTVTFLFTDVDRSTELTPLRAGRSSCHTPRQLCSRIRNSARCRCAILASNQTRRTQRTVRAYELVVPLG
jgi:hypothetical protein